MDHLMQQGLHYFHRVTVQMFGGKIDFILLNHFVFGPPKFYGTAPSISLALAFGLDGNGRFREFAGEKVSIEERKTPV
jgi:hypothetical protein